MEILEQNLDDFFYNLNVPNFDLISEMCTTTSTTSSQASAHGNGDQRQTSIINSWNAAGQETSAAAAAVVEAPQLISFEKNHERLISSTSIHITDSNLTPQIITFSSSSSVNVEDDFGKRERVLTATRTPSQAQDHLISERKRRDNLRQLFIHLSKLVPGLRKLDKATLLEDAIKHLKSLEERIIALEKGEVMSSTSMSTSNEADNVNFSYIEDAVPSNNYCDAKISVRTTEMDVLIKIYCQKEMGLISRIPYEMEKMRLSVKDIRIMPFGEATLDVTILAEMKSDFVGTVKNIIDHLQALLGPSTQS